MAIQQLSAKEIDQVSGGCCLFFGAFLSCFRSFFKSCAPVKPGCGKTPVTPTKPGTTPSTPVSPA
ncbi:MAG: hypothetical protein ABI171_18285 [Collimonas sp.]|uniref:hypothetical protein n=1 Tax=Collimonas sp. TaxID=1963772 RepID=UPI0032643B7B